MKRKESALPSNRLTPIHGRKFSNATLEKHTEMSRKFSSVGLEASFRKYSSPVVEHATLRIKDGMNAQQAAHVYHREGKNSFDSGDVHGALECFSIAISLNPTSTYYVNRAACYKHFHKYTEAYFDYSFAIRLEPDNGSLYCHRGLCSAKLDRLTLALEDLDEACKIEQLPLHFYCRASIHAEAGDYESSVKDLSRVIDDMQHTTADLRVRSLHRRAAAHFEMRQFDEAISDLDVVCACDPTNVAPYVLKGKVLKTSGDLKAALAALTHAVEQQPEMPELFVDRADVLMRMGDHRSRIEAIKDFDRAAELVTVRVTALASQGSVQNTPHSSVRSQSQGQGPSQTPLNKQMRRRNSHFGLSQILDQNVPVQPATAAEDPQNTAQPGSSGSVPGTPHLLVSGGSPMRKRLSLRMSITGAVEGASVEPGSDFSNLLGDILNRRAQGKLLLEDDKHRKSALEDALEALRLCPEEEFFMMVAAVCHQRLGSNEQAIKLVRKVLTKNPRNERALFHEAFCLRQEGRFMDAIESLTKIIASHYSESGKAEEDLNQHGFQDFSFFTSETSKIKQLINSKSNNGLDPFLDTTCEMPLAQVLEMRGAIFHGMKSFKMAAKDLGLAIALDRCRPESYFLRGDCHCRLGHYEQALNDFALAEEYGFLDHPGLLAARGAVLRITGDPGTACRDFELALEHLESESDVLGTPLTFSTTALNVRLRTLIALCMIDQTLYDKAYEQLQQTKQILDSVDLQALPVGVRPRLQWSIYYHESLCHYMKRKYRRCTEVLYLCVNELKDDATDPIDVGAAMFFLGVAEGIVGNNQECLDVLNRCFENAWTAADRQLQLLLFARGKAFQRLGCHEEALSDFTACITNDHEHAHAIFRRAWSYKALGMYEEAALDFEKARECRPNDPNFSIQYKHIHSVEYMEIDSDPDLIEPFPPLLPLPGDFK